MESLFEESYGNGRFQYRTIFLCNFQLFALQSIFQLPVFYGQTLPHECSDEGEILEPYSPANESEHCQFDCNMATSFVNDFGMICNDIDLQKYIVFFLMGPNIIGGK